MAYPPEFDCPIGMMIMTDPVSDDIGMTFDRPNLMTWLTANNNRHPIVQGRMLNPTSLKPNYALKSQIERYLATATAPATAPAVTTTVNQFVQQPLTVTATSASDSAYIRVKVTPPVTGLRQPVALFIALDNSGSMNENASPPTEGATFTRMDLCKHTIRTIAGMLSDCDSLCLVSFSTGAKVVLAPTLMNSDGKQKLEHSIGTVIPDASTNIWAGLELLNRLASAPEFVGRNVAAALLTDGMPNINPPRGILSTFKDLKKPALFSLSTFGFGSQLDSHLLSDIASVGGGSFGFIPDYSMVATVFINWASTVLATAATNQTIHLHYADGTFSEIATGPIQFGQSRTFILQQQQQQQQHAVQSVQLNNTTTAFTAGSLTNDDMAYVELIDCIKHCISTGGSRDSFNGLYAKYPTSEIVGDVTPSQNPDDEGQVIMAPRYYETWGKHYLRAYLRAQELQQCMNFKDRGLQIYGGELFHTIQATGDEVFAHLPPLLATGTKPFTTTGQQQQQQQQQQRYVGTINMPPTFNMGMFNNPGGGCWASDSQLLMDDSSRKSIRDVRKGDKVWTPSGPALVEYAVELGTKALTRSMCQIGELMLTPYHPVLIDGIWKFPIDLVSSIESMEPSVYNLVLDKGHIVNVSNILSATLGHGFTGSVIEHNFFGNMESVVYDLASQPGFMEGRPIYKNLKCRRDCDNLVTGWYDSV